MSFKDQMRVEVSNAELKFRLRLTKENVAGWTTDEWICLLQTKPDIMFPEQKIAVYLDGPPHSSLNVQKRDLTINYYLEKRGWKVLRLPYFRWTKTIENQAFLDLKKLLKL